MTEHGKRKPQLWDLICLFLLAALPRFALLWVSAGQIGADQFLTFAPDTKNYLDAARSLIDGTSVYVTTLTTFGPGFPVLLVPFLKLFGHNPYPFLIFQIILSSACSLLIYDLGVRLTGKRMVGLLAGGIAGFSITSIVLSCAILSDTVFLFLLLLSLSLFFRGLDSNLLWHFIASGVILGIAILTRSIGQFLPLLLMTIAFVYCWRREATPDTVHIPFRKRLIPLGVFLAIVLSIEAGWIARNYAVNGFVSPSFASAGGPANVAALTLQKLTGKPFREIKDAWVEDYQEREQNHTPLSYGELYQLFRARTDEVLHDHPALMIQTYLEVVWENTNAIDYVHRSLLPKFNSTTIPWEYYVKDNYLNYVPFILAMSGLIALMIIRSFRAALILGLLYLYFSLMTGFTLWQGSRLFLPGLSAWPILCAVLAHTMGSILMNGVHWASTHGARFIRSTDRR